MAYVHRIEADNQLSRLVEEAKNGTEVVITNDGQDVARVISLHPIDWEKRKASVLALENFRATHKLNGLTPKQLVEEGRRY